MSEDSGLWRVNYEYVMNMLSYEYVSDRKMAEWDPGDTTTSPKSWPSSPIYFYTNAHLPLEKNH